MKLLLIEWIDASVVGDQWTDMDEARSLAADESYDCGVTNRNPAAHYLSHND